MKKELKKSGVIAIAILFVSLFFTSSILAQSISTGAISGSPFCDGSTVAVSYSKSGGFNPSNIFTAQLSDASGSFASPISIGTLATNTSGTISATIPQGTASGSAYRIRVVSSIPVVIGTDNGTDLTIETTPAITAMTSITCSGVGFSVSPVNGINGLVPVGTTYSWPAPIVTGGMTGGAASNGSPTNITGALINPTNTSQTATYSVTPVSGSCPGNTFTLTITVNPTPGITAMASTICTGNSFAVAPVNGIDGVVPSGTTYSWPAPIVTGGLTGGVGSIGSQTSITGTLTNPSSNAQTATYTVTPISGSCSGNSFTVTITVDQTPAITNILEFGTSDFSFTVTPVNGIDGVVPAGTTYSWSLPFATGGMTGGEASSGSPTSITGTLTNLTTTAQLAIYTVTPTSGSCVGNNFYVSVIVDPISHLYSYQTGDWDNPNTWTTDPSGNLQIGNSIPGDYDRVTILSGRTVSLQNNIDLENLEVTINAGAFLDQGVYGFTQTLHSISGQGTLKLASVNFPDAVTNTFVNSGGGTTEYDNTTNFILPITQTTYNNLTINSPGFVATQLSDIMLNGDLNIKNGTFQINDNVSTIKRTLTINGDVSVDTGAYITVGNGVTNTAIGGSGGIAPFLNYYLNFHTVIIKGDLTNNGTVKFTNLPYPIYNAFPPSVAGPSSGAASVYFQGSSNNTLNCYGVTDFYNLIVDKGIDRTYKLTIYSTDYANFSLFGANVMAIDGALTINPNLRKALWIRAGTLVLKGSLIIPSLSEGTAGNADYYIPSNGGLELDGVDVVILSTADDYREVNVAYSAAAPNNATIGVSQGGRSAVNIFGQLQIKRGYFSTRESGGLITSGGSGKLIINDGVVDAKQFLSSTGSASYNQSGGLFILRGRFQRAPIAYTTVSNLIDVSLSTLNTSRAINGINSDFGSFNLEQSNNIFTQSGGTIRIYDVCGTTGTEQEAFDVKSSVSNINVTGGTLEIKPVAGTILANSANYLIYTSAPLINLIIDRISSTSAVQLNSFPLIVKNNFTLTAGDFSANNLDVNVGGDFFVGSGTSYNCGNNTTLLNGSGNQTLTVNLAVPLSFNKLTINKPSGVVVDLNGSQNIVNVNDNFSLILGTLNDNGKTINVFRDLYNSGLHFGSGKIALNGTLLQSIDGNGIFQNVELNNTNAATAPVSLAANMTINGNLIFLQDKLFNIGIHNLQLNAFSVITNAGSTRYIQTAGNAGDGGVTKEYTSIGAFTFPVGAPTITPALPVKYTPATIGFSAAPADYGKITVIPVGYEHPSTTINGQSLTYFWRIHSSGFTGIVPNSITHSFTYDQSDVAGIEANYIPALYTNNDYTWRFGTNSNPPINITNNIFTDWTTPSNSADFLDADYTAGDNAFGVPQVYYSRQNGLWGNLATWSLTGHMVNNPPATPPGVNDVVIIGGQDSVYLATNNTVPNTDVRSCASLQIETGSALDIGYNFNSSFGIVQDHPNGNGNFRLTTSWTSGSTFTFPFGDFTDFNINLGTTELYSTNPTAGTTYWLPNGIFSYGNLILSPLGGSNIIFANNDLTIYGNLITRGQNADSWFLPTWNVNYPTPPTVRVPKTITIVGDMHIQGGALMWYGNGNITQDFVINGDVIVETLSAMYVWSGATSQSISIGGSLINNTDGLTHGLSTRSKVDFTNIPVTFFGPSDASITNTTGNPWMEFSLLTIDKGTSPATTLTCDITGSLITPTNNWLTLQNGTFRYMRTDPGTDFTISTNSPFTVSSTAGLTIDYTNANNRNILIGNANNNNGDLLLSGTLTLISGNVYIGPIAAPGNNNDIEYSGSGASAIEVQGGNLVVNGQIRRNTITTNGILKYTQSGGNVRVNGNNTNVSYAKLEVLNEASSFSMSGGTITIVRGGGTSYGDLYLRPSSYSVTGGTIIFTNVIPDTQQNYSVDANIPLNNLTITGAAGAGINANLDLLISPLELNGTLTLNNQQSIFNTNNIDVSIKGNLDNIGIYNYGFNTTTFNGGVQEITGSSVTNFYNLNISSTNSLTVNNNFTVNQDLSIVSGNLILGNQLITLYGNLMNNGSYNDDNTIGGISFSGITQQQIFGSGSYGRLEINNSSGVKLNSGILLQNNLVFIQGILDINSKLLTLSQSCNIIGSTDINNMIMSEGVVSSSGVRKFFSAGLQSFTFPIGVLGKYTPAHLTITANATVGYVRVSPINEFHPSVSDSLNVLNYYWKIESAGISGFDGDFLLQYDDNDVAGTESDYVAARLVLPGNTWSTAPPGSGTDNVDETNHQISFYYSASNNLSGDYTAGNSTAFPTEISTYETNDDGDWADNTIWTPLGSSPPCPVGGPVGANVIINHAVTVDINDISALSTIINNRLRILSPTFGHSLGDIAGSGTIYVESGNIPAGNYTVFLDCSGDGTLEYGGTGTYTIIADQYTSLPNLFFTGTGTRILPNKDITICKRLVIDGPLLDNSINNYKLTILGSMERYNTGAFNSGTGTAPASTVSFAGDALQTLGGPTGDFTGVNKFNNLEINNDNGLEIGLNGTVEVNNQLLLTNGNINTTADNKLILLNISPTAVLPGGGSTTSFINGPLIKKIINGDDFLYPLGKDTIKGHHLTLTSTAGTILFWTAEYFTPNPTSFSLSPPLQATNTMEYWSVNTSTVATATVKLAWDRRSVLTPLMTPNGLADIRVSEFNTGSWNELPSAANGDDYNGDVETTNNVSFSTTPKNYTIASVEQELARASFTTDEPVCGESGIPLGFAYYDPINLDYTIDYTIDGIAQPTVDITSLPYTLPTPISGVYQLTNFTFNNGANTGVVDTTVVYVYDPPMSADAGEDQLLCGISGTVLEGNDPAPYSGVWTIISGLGGILVDNSLNTTVFTGALDETYTLRWTVSNASCTSSDEVVIAFSIIPGQPANFTSAPSPVCQGLAGNIYTVPNEEGVTYDWSYSGTGATINGSGNTVNIDFDLSATSGTLSVTATNSCGTSQARTVDIIVDPLPVANFSYVGSPYYYTAPNPLPTFSGGGTAGTFTSTPGLVFVSSATGEVDIAGSTPGEYTVTNTIAAAGGCGNVIETSPIIIYDKITWTGNVSTDWNIAGNWLYDLTPELTKDALIPNVTNKPILSSGSNGTVKNITIESGSSVTITGNTLEISGAIINSGTFDANAGTIEMNGTLAQSLDGDDFITNTIENLMISNAAGVILTGNLNITGIITVNIGDLASNGYLTLVSTATQTALINGAGGGEVIGDVTMQRYLPSGFGYKYFSSPFQAATVNEFGDDMDLTASFPTFYTYNESLLSAGWESYVTPTNVLDPMSGYAINFGTNVTPKTVDVTGDVNNGSLSRTIYNNDNTYTEGFNLYGNPYPSPIDWDAASGWTKTNIDNALYYFKAGGADHYSGTYSTYINGISSDGQATNIIPSMQGFFVHVADGVYPVTGLLGMNNTVRIDDLTHPFLKSNENYNNVFFRLSTTYTDNPNSSDPMVIYFEGNATKEFDSDFDALKLMNTDEEVTNLYSLLPDGTKLSINALPEMVDSLITIPLGLVTYRSGEIIFRINDLENLYLGMKIYLHDAAMGINQNLFTNEEYRTYLEEGEYTSRFSIRILNNSPDLPKTDLTDAFNVFYSNGLLEANIGYLGGDDGVLQLFDLAGRNLLNERVNENDNFNFNPRVSNGIYIVVLLSGNEVKTKKILINK